MWQRSSNLVLASPDKFLLRYPSGDLTSWFSQKTKSDVCDVIVAISFAPQGSYTYFAATRRCSLLRPSDLSTLEILHLWTIWARFRQLISYSLKTDDVSTSRVPTKCEYREVADSAISAVVAERDNSVSRAVILRSASYVMRALSSNWLRSSIISVPIVNRTTSSPCKTHVASLGRQMHRGRTQK